VKLVSGFEDIARVKGPSIDLSGAEECLWNAKNSQLGGTSKREDLRCLQYNGLGDRVIL